MFTFVMLLEHGWTVYSVRGGKLVLVEHHLLNVHALSPPPPCQPSQCRSWSLCAVSDAGPGYSAFSASPHRCCTPSSSPQCVLSCASPEHTYQNTFCHIWDSPQLCIHPFQKQFYDQPVCVSTLWILKAPPVVEAFLHLPQANGFSPMCARS